MKNSRYLLAAVTLSLLPACGDKGASTTGGDATAKATSSAVASADTGDDKKHHHKRDGKADASGDASGTASDAPKPDSGSAGSATPAAAGTALAHLSDDCIVAAHLDVAQLVASPSFQRAIVPNLDDLLATNSKDKDFEKFQTFLKDAGLDYKKSVHDVAVCVTDIKDAEHSWTVMIGTDMKPDTLAPAFGKNAKEGKVEDLDGHKVFVKDQVTIGQAADGVVVIAPSKAAFQKATAAKGASAYTLDASKYVSFVVREAATAALFAMADPKKVEQFKAIKKVVGASDLSTLKTDMVADCGTADDAKKLDSLITLMKDELVKKAGTGPGADALKTLTSHADGSNVTVEISTPQAAYDQALDMAGAQIKAAKAKL